MAGAIGDISSGLVGVSHTTGNEYQAMPSKSAIRPSVSAKAADDVHISKALAVDNSQNKLMKFVRGDRLSSYTPQDNRELRNDVLEMASRILQEQGGEINESDKNLLNSFVAQLKYDAELEMVATMAKNILIPA